MGTSVHPSADPNRGMTVRFRGNVMDMAPNFDDGNDALHAA
jgi:hypothetical protein